MTCISFLCSTCIYVGHQQHHFKEPEPLRWEIPCGMNNALKEMNDNSEFQPLDIMILLYSTVGIELQASLFNLGLS